ncbi:MAG: acyl carrier protein [Pseudomonadota bacterium]
MRQAIKSAPDNFSLDAMIKWICQKIASERLVPIDDIDPDASFVGMGLDSMSAVTLSGDLEMALNVRLPPTLIWDHPNISALARYLVGTVRQSETVNG